MLSGPTSKPRVWEDESATMTTRVFTALAPQPPCTWLRMRPWPLHGCSWLAIGCCSPRSSPGHHAQPRPEPSRVAQVFTGSSYPLSFLPSVLPLGKRPHWWQKLGRKHVKIEDKQQLYPEQVAQMRTLITSFKLIPWPKKALDLSFPHFPPMNMK